MSTKSTVYHDNGSPDDGAAGQIHIYTECYNEAPTHPLYVDKHTTVGTITLELPWKSLLAIKNHVESTLKWIKRQAEQTDEEIRKEALETVSQRISSHGIGKMIGFLQYGSADDPPEEQIARGIQSLTEYRELCKEALAQIK